MQAGKHSPHKLGKKSFRVCVKVLEQPFKSDAFLKKITNTAWNAHCQSQPTPWTIMATALGHQNPASSPQNGNITNLF
eukprot:scaffold39489_cov19-Tisochrysis_lutea.AAC.5